VSYHLSWLMAHVGRIKSALWVRGSPHDIKNAGNLSVGIKARSPGPLLGWACRAP